MTNQNNEKSKNGKRLALILIAILLLVAIAFGAYTYSRYVTRDSGNGSAEVAMWGYTVNIGNSDGFTDDLGFAYNYDSTGAAQSGASGAVIATIDSDSRLVAPGAKGSTTFSVTGASEVAAEIVASITNVKQVALTLTVDGGTNTFTYNPMVYTLRTSDTSKGTSGLLASGSLGQIISYLQTDSGLTSLEKRGPGYYTEDTTTYTLSWEWAFQGGTRTAYESTFDCDVMDTVLGQISTGNENVLNTTLYVVDNAGQRWNVTGSSIEESFTLTVGIQQIQSLS